MSKKEKLISRFRSKPKDFSWDELVTLLRCLGYEHRAAGKTGGSRRKFIGHGLPVIILHKPHPGNIVRLYQLEQIEKVLIEGGIVK